MPFALSEGGVRIHFEESGRGTPILFLHEFAGDHRSWDAQIGHFSRRHRCIALSARGYLPSDVPQESGRYSQEIAVTDALAVLDQLHLARAHVVGLSMGGGTALHLALRHPNRVTSLVLAATGSGSDPDRRDEFRALAYAVADRFETLGAAAYAKTHAEVATRLTLRRKDPRGWQSFVDRLASHSSEGAALTMRGVQAKRPSVQNLKGELNALETPALIVVGDEDEPCLATALFLKRNLQASGLAVLPQTGHAVNLEEPSRFNDLLAEFFAQVESGFWATRDPNAAHGEIMRVAPPP
jgi:pimeloyl-ACP methyl ester carboxylesterase